jgi:hypothetical protein
MGRCPSTFHLLYTGTGLQQEQCASFSFYFISHCQYLSGALLCVQFIT